MIGWFRKVILCFQSWRLRDCLRGRHLHLVVTFVQDLKVLKHIAFFQTPAGVGIILRK